MSWNKELEELRRRQALAQELGGAERVQRHKDGGKLTVRERIDALLDPGSFREVGSIAGKAGYDDAGNITAFTPAQLVMGRGTLDGRPVVWSPGTTSPCAAARPRAACATRWSAPR